MEYLPILMLERRTKPAAFLLMLHMLEDTISIMCEIIKNSNILGIQRFDC